MWMFSDIAVVAVKSLAGGAHAGKTYRIEWTRSDIEPRAGEANFQGDRAHGELRGHIRNQRSARRCSPRYAEWQVTALPGTSSSITSKAGGCEDGWSATGIVEREAG